MTPAVGVALIDVMSPTEALNSRSWVERSGLLAIPEVKDAFANKLSKATASIASADFRKSAKGQDLRLDEAIEVAKERAVAKADKIEGVVDIYLDTSFSMQHAINAAPKFAERLWPLCEDKALFVHTTGARLVKVDDTGRPLIDVRNALAGVRAGGGTQHHSAFEASLRLGRMPDRIVLLTDGGENGSIRRFARAVEQYEVNTGQVPQIVMIHFDGDPDRITPSLETAGYQVDKFHFDVREQDYYIFDQVLATMGGPPAKSLVDRIMETELPRRVK
jgi:hypothetical protein